jgi:DNA-binding XRE family transcriptional regulator
MTKQDPHPGSGPDSDRDHRIAEAARLYGTGLSLRQVAAKQSVSRQTVANDLAAGNIARRKAGPRPGYKPDGPRLRQLRVSRGLRTRDLARRIGRDLSTISKAEAGTIQISDVLAYQIANALSEAGRNAGLAKPEVKVRDILADGDDIESEPEPKALAS